MPRPVEDLTYTIPEAARAMGVSAPVVRALIARRELPCLQIGTRKLVVKTALVEWMTANADHQFQGPKAS